MVHARDLNAADLLTSDPYARVFIDNEFVGQTNIVPRTTSPVWNYRFKIPLLHPYVVMRYVGFDTGLFTRMGMDGLLTFHAV